MFCTLSLICTKMTTKDELKKFAEDGFVVLEGFLNDEDVAALRGECRDLVEEMNPEEHNTVFSTTKHVHRNNYFIESADSIGYFFEEAALDEKGQLIVPKQKSLNKVAHALHAVCPNFKRVTHSDKVKKLFKNLNYKDPTVVQSMYIFKQPKIGGQVVCHQDATYLYTEPLVGMVTGVWIALEDATEENGCLWFQPGSHKGGLHGEYRSVLNPDSEGPTSIYVGERQTYDESKFIPVPVKKGDCLLIDGLVVHKSEKNTSDKSRHIYTFHVYDQAQAEWSPKNWLQETDAKTFTHLNEVEV